MIPTVITIIQKMKQLSESEWLEMRRCYLNKMVMEKYYGEMSFEQIIK